MHNCTVFSKQERSANDRLRIDESRCGRIYTDGKILSLEHLQRSETGFDSFDTQNCVSRAVYEEVSGNTGTVHMTSVLLPICL